MGAGVVARLEEKLSDLRGALGIRPRVRVQPVPSPGRVVAQSEWGLKLKELSQALLTLGDLPVLYEEGDLFPGQPDSYRGYYEDLALSRNRVTPATPPWSAADLGRRLAQAIGEGFCGYKGGEFVMHEKTTMWSADYGDNSGLRITGVVAYDDRVVLTTGREA